MLMKNIVNIGKASEFSALAVPIPLYVVQSIFYTEE